MAKNEKDRQTNNSTRDTQHRKLKNKQHEPHSWNGFFVCRTIYYVP